jgi:hypothetical protein
VNPQRFARSIAALLFAGSVSPTLALAYVDIELDGNRHIVGDSYSASDTKLVVYRRSGNVEVDRASVRSIREVQGEMPTEVQQPVARPASEPASASSASVSAAAPPTHAADPAARDEELGRSLMDLHLNRLAARQRKDAEALKKLDAEIGKVEAERVKNWKKLHPGETEEPRDGN